MRLSNFNVAFRRKNRHIFLDSNRHVNILRNNTTFLKYMFQQNQLKLTKLWVEYIVWTILERNMTTFKLLQYNQSIWLLLFVTSQTTNKTIIFELSPGLAPLEKFKMAAGCRIARATAMLVNGESAILRTTGNHSSSLDIHPVNKVDVDVDVSCD